MNYTLKTRKRLGSTRSALVCAIAIALATSASHADRPPSPDEIFETMDRYWKHRNFDAFDSYIESLVKRYPTYVPVIAADLVRTYHRGAQSELLLEGLEDLELRFKKYPAHVPIGYRKTLASFRERQESMIDSYERHGLSVDVRLEKYRPENVYTGDGLAAFRFLVESAATISLPQSPEEEIEIHDFYMPGQYRFPGAELDSLVDLAKKTTDPDECRAALDAIAAAQEHEAVPRLAELIKSRSPYANHFAAERISTFGTMASPVLNRILTEPGPISQREYAIYALLRIGELTPEAEKALTALTEKKGPLGQYAKEALAYLGREH